MSEDEFHPPPEAPVFEPDEKDFADPLSYIAKIRPIAEKAGICKVRPPPYWQPPFAIDVENFKFTPRIQRLNELGIQTRMRLQFIHKLAKFWELQGTNFKLPHIAGRPLDIYGLHHAVERLGGFEMVTKHRQWHCICQKLGLIKNLSATIKQHYEKLLYPYDIMLSGILLETVNEPAPSAKLTGHISSLTKVKEETGLDDVKPRNKRRCVEDSLLVDVSNNKELAKLQLFGAGPKMMGLGLIAKRKNRLKSQEVGDKINVTEGVKSDKQETHSKNIFEVMELETKAPTNVKAESECEEPVNSKHEVVETRRKTSNVMPYSVLESIDNCKVCQKDENETCLLLCDGCDDSYHTYCLIPPLLTVPKGDWCCPKCLAKECNKKIDAYGFEQARKEYTLQSFGEMADTFKSEYFTKPAHMVPTELVEKEFWRLVSSLEEDLSVQYGADIHVLDQGSGFPRLSDCSKHPLSPEETVYARSGWNLNNLPVSKQSLLSSMSGDISGMKVPWVYVGMCFSAFCWHIEDHWTYSINYLHWGEPKTWYGVPREDATKLEEVMKGIAPELFKQHPDIMHHLVTTINPSILMKNGVRVVRTNQCAGEFVITFPRAYHAGFNQGYNFAEAVNFCPADWIPIGRQSVSHYCSVSRPCVFSHEEIICKVANSPESLDVQLAAAVYKDMIVLIQEENIARETLTKMGIDCQERIAFELVPDDERQCCVCKTTCFLSAVVCSCIPEKLVCLKHVADLCDSCSYSQCVLRYRYTLEELPPMLNKVKQRADSFETWACKVENALGNVENKLTLNELKELLEEAFNGRLPENDRLHQLQSAIHEAEKCCKLAQQLITVKKHRTRQKELNIATGIIPLPSGTCVLSLDEIRAFYRQLLNLPCTISHMPQICECIKKVERFVQQAEKLLQEEEPSSKKIEYMIESSLDFDIDLPQIPLLHTAKQQAKWLEEVRTTVLMDNVSGVRSQVTLHQLRQLLDAGVSLPPRPAIERAMAELQELLNLSEAWEEKASIFLRLGSQGSLNAAEVVASESKNIPVVLPYCVRLREVVSKGNAWVAKLQTIQNQDFFPYLETLESLLYSAPVNIKLTQLPLLNTQVDAAQEWKKKTSRVFLKKNSSLNLYDVLRPRIKYFDAGSAKGEQCETHVDSRHQPTEKSPEIECPDYSRQLDPVQVVEKIKSMEKLELNMIKQLRVSNNRKGGSSSSQNDSKANDGDCTVYCVCQKASSGMMLQCELCHDWFHVDCVPPIQFSKGKSRLQQIYELKFLCPLCHRSRRPRLEVILSLLLQLQKLPIRIREGEALQCLTERAMNWQDRARDLLSSNSITELLKEVDSKLREGVFNPAKRNWNENIFSEAQECYTKKVSTLDSIDNTISSVILKSSGNYSAQCESSGFEALLSAASKTDTEEDVREAAEVLAMFACGNAQAVYNNSDPAISTEMLQSPDHVSADEGKNGRDLEKEVSHHRFPLISIPNDTKSDLEHLLMEGDLLEVTLEETQQIWKLLQASRPLNDGKYQEFQDTLPCNSVSALHDKDEKRKRKSELFSLRTDTPKKRHHDSCIRGRSEGNKKDASKRKKNHTKKSALDAMVAVDDDEFALCAISTATRGAVKCKQPTGEEVDWLQCDGVCEAWFHCVCVSVTAEEAKDLDYVCETCRCCDDRPLELCQQLLHASPESMIKAHGGVLSSYSKAGDELLPSQFKT